MSAGAWEPENINLVQIELKPKIKVPKQNKSGISLSEWEPKNALRCTQVVFCSASWREMEK
jgi:hypothetical protein